jgi:uncharacterized membrane protein
MKRFLLGLAAVSLSVAQAQAQPTYFFTTIDWPSSTSVDKSVAYGINASGSIVAYYCDGYQDSGFLLDQGSYTGFDNYIYPYGINDSGQIVGAYADSPSKQHGFLIDQGNYTTLDVPGSASTHAYGINNSGQIVGDYSDAAGAHGFLIDNGSYTTLDVSGPLPRPEGSTPRAKSWEVTSMPRALATASCSIRAATSRSTCPVQSLPVPAE